jgi:hypothetical protein
MNTHEQQRQQRLLQFAAEGNPEERARASAVLQTDFGMSPTNIWKNIEQSYVRARTDEIQAAVARIESTLAFEIKEWNRSWLFRIWRLFHGKNQ